MTSLRHPYVIRTVIRRTSAVHPEFIRRISARHPHGAPRQPYIYAVVLHSRDLRTCDGFSDGRCRAGIWPSRKGESGILQVARATPHMHSGKSPPTRVCKPLLHPPVQPVTADSAPCVPKALNFRLSNIQNIQRTQKSTFADHSSARVKLDAHRRSNPGVGAPPLPPLPAFLSHADLPRPVYPGYYTPRTPSAKSASPNRNSSWVRYFVGWAGDGVGWDRELGPPPR